MANVVEIGLRYEYDTVADALGAGTFGTVVRARDRLSLQKTVAIKKSDKTSIHREVLFMLILNATNAFLHPMLFNCNLSSSPLFIAMELVGPSLYSIFHQLGHLDMMAVLNIIKQLISACQYLNDAKIVHADIHTNNICFDFRNRKLVKLIDFGIACFLNQHPRTMLHAGHDRNCSINAHEGGPALSMDDLASILYNSLDLNGMPHPFVGIEDQEDMVLTKQELQVEEVFNGEHACMNLLYEEVYSGRPTPNYAALLASFENAILTEQAGPDMPRVWEGLALPQPDEEPLANNVQEYTTVFVKFDRRALSEVRSWSNEEGILKVRTGNQMRSAYKRLHHNDKIDSYLAKGKKILQGRTFSLNDAFFLYCIDDYATNPANSKVFKMNLVVTHILPSNRSNNVQYAFGSDTQLALDLRYVLPANADD